jgi:hypothetical protein
VVDGMEDPTMGRSNHQGGHEPAGIGQLSGGVGTNSISDIVLTRIALPRPIQRQVAQTWDLSDLKAITNGNYDTNEDSATDPTD